LSIVQFGVAGVEIGCLYLVEDEGSKSEAADNDSIHQTLKKRVHFVTKLITSSFLFLLSDFSRTKLKSKSKQTIILKSK